MVDAHDKFSCRSLTAAESLCHVDLLSKVLIFFYISHMKRHSVINLTLYFSSKGRIKIEMNPQKIAYCQVWKVKVEENLVDFELGGIP